MARPGGCAAGAKPPRLIRLIHVAYEAKSAHADPRKSDHYGENVGESTGDPAMIVESILRQKGADVVTIAPEASIRSAAGWLRAKNIGALVVVSGDAILGLISEREIVHAFSQHGDGAASTPVKDIMIRRLITVSPDDGLNRVMNLMTRHRVRHMPVLRNGKLAGIISIGDVVKHRLEELELEANVIRDAYIATR
jgi:predicted transcriptional regulator